MILKREEWQSRRAAHRRRVAPWLEDHHRRAARGEKHPVYDFLFTYYSFRAAHLLRWSPGVEVQLDGCEETDWPAFFDNGYLSADRFPEHRRSFLCWAIDYQEAILNREPSFGCFGLHEWAMLYRTEDVRHSQVPLRLSMEEIAEVVESQGLRCTHYDAFRFFTPAAVSRNRIQLTRANTPEHDQGGCIHANMDLYKFAYTIAPFTSAELLADAFELARTLRELDMRASPYDLREFGFDPIAIETQSGREDYIHQQRRLAAEAQTLRRRVLMEYRRL
jgi:hypothetical protein